MADKKMAQKKADRLHQSIDECASFVEELNSAGVFEKEDYTTLIDHILCVENAARVVCAMIK